MKLTHLEIELLIPNLTKVSNERIFDIDLDITLNSLSNRQRGHN